MDGLQDPGPEVFLGQILFMTWLMGFSRPYHRIPQKNSEGAAAHRDPIATGAPSHRGLPASGLADKTARHRPPNAVEDPRLCRPDSTHQQGSTSAAGAFAKAGHALSVVARFRGDVVRIAVC